MNTSVQTSSKKQIASNEMHHALFIEYRFPDEESLRGFIETEVFADIENVSVRYFQFDSLSIADARSISKASLLTPETAETQLLVISFQKINHDAQHALLKTLEDPLPTTKFILASHSFALLIPTLQSRLQRLTYIDESSQDFTEVSQFLGMDLPARIARVTSLAEDKEAAQRFVHALTSYALATHPSDREMLKVLEASGRYFNSPSPSVKMILENLAIGLPRISSVQ